MRRSRSPKIRSDGGYVLLEVLISILLFSLGVLGLITIQANAVQAAGEANMRAEAVFAANEITGRMWVDRSNLASSAGATSVAALPNGQAASPSTGPRCRSSSPGAPRARPPTGSTRPSIP